MAVIYDPILSKLRSGKSSGGSGTGFTAIYSTHATLVANETPSGTNNIFLVRQTTSTLLFFNRKQAGIWIDDPDTLAFEYLGSSPSVFADGELAFYNSVDETKEVDFDLSGITTATRRTITFSDKSGTIAYLDDISLVPDQRTVNTASPSAILSTDGTILFDTASTPISINLPLASVGKVKIPFKDIGANSVANNITFNRVGSDTIVDFATGQTTTIIASDGFSGYFLSNGVDTWYLF
jgi:hypothetical protein